MKFVFQEKKECSGCGACANICPKNCILMECDEEGFAYPKVNQTMCIDCNLCRRICTFQKDLSASRVIGCYAAYNMDTEVRMKSSSGAIFSVLAMTILEKGGIVYGSAFTEDFKKVTIRSAETTLQLEALYGSKYIQSDPEDIYQKVEKQLLKKREVLFSGTPCQIGGLKSFLGKEYNNLYCMDIVCHGTPSPALWERYIQHVENKHHGKMSAVNFRCKDYGWRNFGIKEKIAGKWLYTSKTKNPYMSMFLQNFSLRPSCYNCKMKGHNVADISIGDFWGINEVFSDLNDEKGISAIIVRTEKGRQMIETVRESIVIQECTYEDITRRNIAELRSVTMPNERKTFFVDMNRLDFHDLQKKYVGSKFKQKIKRIIKRINKKS